MGEGKGHRSGGSNDRVMDWGLRRKRRDEASGCRGGGWDGLGAGGEG